MKTVSKFLALLACATLVCACTHDEPSFSQDYEILCSFTVDNYNVGDRLVFERTNGQLDTLIVTLVDKELYATMPSELPDSAQNMRTYAQVRIEMTDQEGPDGWYHLAIDCALHYNYEFLLTGGFGWNNSHKKPYSDGADFRINSLPTEILRTNEYFEDIKIITFAELKKGKGLVRFGDRDGEIWTLKKRL